MKLLILSLLISGSAFSEAPKKVDRWLQLNNLVAQEMKILENAKRKGPELYYRMLELHSEKLKLIHEKNNHEFLDKSKTAKSAVNKESFFKETRQYYDFTKSFGLKILKDFPQNNRRGEILFALALNSRDFGRDNITEKYLLETISMVKDPHHSLRHHAETALADFYYNEKKFNEAITYYERAIKKTEDEWLTKHYFNLSWCYLKVREFDKAINSIKVAYRESKNPAYVNIKDQVLDNIGSFYVYAGRPLEGLDFYLENEKDPIPYLFPMAVKTSEKGHEKETEKVLASVQKLIDKNEWYKYQEELFHAYLDFYRHYSRFSDHEKTSRELVAYYKKAESNKDKELKLPIAMKEEAIEKMRSLAGYLQVKLAKDMKADEQSFKENELEIVLSFFSHLIILDAPKQVEYFYFRAETYYSVRLFKEAAPSYVQTVNEAKRTKNDEYARKSLNSLLALTGQEVLEKDENTKFLIFAYTEHLEFWPRDDMSEQIYPKLFEIYHEKQDDSKSSVVMRAFHKHYPEHLADQQKMMTRILDQFIEKQDTKKLAQYIHEFKTGFLKFSAETIEKTEIVLGNILFLQFQEMAKKGDKYAAAKGFESIYVNKLYTDKVKSQSAFFAALAWLEMGETVISYNWQVLSHARMTEEEKLERRGEQLKIAERMYMLQDFKTSYTLSEFLLNKFCSLRDETQNRLYEVAVMTALVENQPMDAEKIAKNFDKCTNKPELKDTALSQTYSFYEKQGDFYGLRKFIQRNHKEPYITQYRYSLQKWYWERTSLTLKEHILQEFKALNEPETKQWLGDIRLHENAMKEAQELKATQIWNKPVFNGDEFNKNLEAYLMRVQNFKAKYQGLTQSTQVDLAIFATQLFSSLYLNAGESILNLKPAGMDSAMVKDFQGAMKQVATPFVTAAKKYSQQLSKALKEKETLSHGSRSIASVESVENPVFSFFTGLTMDKGKE